MSAQHFSDSNLDFWMDNSLNVLLRGKHGVGKTARILEAFKRKGLKYQYFSASTMDPWVDFIGVPKEKTGPDGVSYLDLVRPKVWQDDAVEAIFLDEFNRSSKKVRNAVMELIQFKSINGKVFKNLKMVWAAINPEDEEVNKYDVEALDPAQMDRFHVIINVPYQPDASYFRGKYGRDMADVALDWWKNTLKDNERELVSPRRLDYVLEIFQKNGDVRPLLHTAINSLQLTTQLKNGPLGKQLEDLVSRKDMMGARKFLTNENSFASAINHILKKPDHVEFFIPLLSPERLTVLMSQHKPVAAFVFSNYANFSELIKNIASSKTGQLSTQAANCVMNNVKVTDLAGGGDWKSTASDSTYANKLKSIKQMDMSSTVGRKTVYAALVEYMSENQTRDVAIDTLKILEPLVLRTNREDTMNGLPELPRMFAHVAKVLDGHNIRWEGLVDSKTVLHKLNDLNVLIKSQKDINSLRGEEQSF